MKKKHLSSVLRLFTAGVIFFYSCQEPEFRKIDQPHNFSGVFELFWNEMNVNYVYWDLDTTDWDQQYLKYQNVFASLDLNDTRDVLKSVEYFKAMTAGLVDGHFNISFTHNVISDVTIDPLLERRKRTGELNFFYTYLPYDTIYLDPGFKIGYDHTVSVSGSPLICVSGLISKDIIYFSCNRFLINKSVTTNPAGDVKKTLDYFFGLLKDAPPTTKGIILDVRGNSGGDLSDLNYLIGHFVDASLHIGYTQYKRDYGRLDFTPWIKAYVNPEPHAGKIELPVIIMADRYSSSLAETCVMAIQSIPNGIFLGENTWGATGPVVAHEVYKSGSFEINNFMKVRASSCKFKYLDDQIYESKGLIPDVYIQHAKDAYEKGIDIQLEKAIQLMN